MFDTSDFTDKKRDNRVTIKVAPEVVEAVKAASGEHGLQASEIAVQAMLQYIDGTFRTLPISAETLEKVKTKDEK